MGLWALVALGIPTTPKLAMPQRGDFVVQCTSLWNMDRATLQASLRSDSRTKNVVILDGCTAAEYAGSTFYREARGGHIPGAVHLYYKKLMNVPLLPAGQILARLQRRGHSRCQDPHPYCTTGIQLAWLTAVLTNLGLQAKSYSGSIYE
ncbi:MAG: sulfurtransferase [Cyanobacteriota bacterium]